jgi:gamma-glutamyltranspeptidase / glutathione hydrolase
MTRVLNAISIAILPTIAFSLPVIALDRTTNGMVTSAHPLATDVGLSILKQGGNAIDAAISTTLAISVVEPFSAGIGGGGFLMVHDAKSGEMQSLDFRERAPLAATKDLYLDGTGKVLPKRSVDGHLAVAVPGTIAGLYAAHRRYGKLPWRQLVLPSVTLARTGFPVSDRFRLMLSFRKDVIAKSSDAAKLFLPGGKTPAIGTQIIQTDLAKTLEKIAENPEDFYTGTIAKAIVLDMKQNNGLVTAEDLKQYRPIWRSPLCKTFERKTIELKLNPLRICSMPPPSSGGVHLLQMLNLIGFDDAKRSPWHDPNSVHRLIESMKIAYADRATHLGDPDFVSVPVNTLISDAYATQRRQQILPTATPSKQIKAVDAQTLQRLQKESHDTSHLNVIDADRNAVSLTFTVNLSFGAGVIATGTGIILNNEMDDFAIAPDTPNAFGLTGQVLNSIAPRKTPLSSMTPTIVTENGNVKLAVGAPGGSTIITTVLQVILNHFVYDMPIARAIAAPRLHHQWLPDETRVDRWGLDPLTLADLKARGQTIVEREPWGNANGIAVLPNGELAGAVDPRGEGRAAGY